MSLQSFQTARSFLIFALHLLFSFQDTFSLLFSEQISEESFCSFLLKSSLNERNGWAKVDSNHRPHAYQACALTG